jgi:hypothetical protein
MPAIAGILKKRKCLRLWRSRSAVIIIRTIIIRAIIIRVIHIVLWSVAFICIWLAIFLSMSLIVRPYFIAAVIDIIVAGFGIYVVGLWQRLACSPAGRRRIIIRIIFRRRTVIHIRVGIVIIITSRRRIRLRIGGKTNCGTYYQQGEELFHIIFFI